MNTKKLFTYISLVILMLVLSATGFSKDKSVVSKWTAQPPTIDGQNEDWKGDAMSSEKKVKVDYAIRNDAQNMYVLFIFKDPKYLSTINFSGITLYYNTEGKKNKDHAFHFIRKKVTPDELIAYLKKRGEVLTEQQIQSIKSKSAFNVFMTERVGKKDEEISITDPIPANMNPGFKFSRKGSEFIYEFRIPLIKSETSPRGMGVEPGQSIKIGFEWGGMTKAIAARMRGAGAISRESGAGGMIDSTRGTTGALKTGRAMPKKHSLWFDVKLAQNQ